MIVCMRWTELFFGKDNDKTVEVTIDLNGRITHEQFEDYVEAASDAADSATDTMLRHVTPGAKIDRGICYTIKTCIPPQNGKAQIKLTFDLLGIHRGEDEEYVKDVLMNGIQRDLEHANKLCPDAAVGISARYVNPPDKMSPPSDEKRGREH